MRRPAFSESRKMGVHSAKPSIWHLIQKEHSDIPDFCALKCFYNFEINSMLEFLHFKTTDEERKILVRQLKSYMGFRTMRTKKIIWSLCP